MPLLLTALVAAAAGGLASFSAGVIFETLYRRFLAPPSQAHELPGVITFVVTLYGTLGGAIGGILGRTCARRYRGAAAYGALGAFIPVAVVMSLFIISGGPDRSILEVLAEALGFSAATAVGGAVGGLVGKRSIREKPLQFSLLGMLVGIVLASLLLGIVLPMAGRVFDP